jgi:dTDP-4-amino-4,6-dideoxygalactose transaminase
MQIMGLEPTYKVEFKENIKKILGLSSIHVYVFWKGRVALYAILQAMNMQSGDEVIMPAFTCVVVPNPVIYLGGVPVYVDIEPLTYNMDVDKIEQKITPRTKFILAQNTYGLSSDFDAIKTIAKKHNIKVIEDCAHGFGGLYKGMPNGTIAEAAFYSTQWNKPFSTGLGGVAVTAERDIAEKLQQLEQKFYPPTLKDVMLLKLLYLLKQYMLTPEIYWTALKLYRWLSRHNLILGSSQGIELVQPVEPKYFAKGFSTFQAKAGINQLKNFDKIREHRKRIAKTYNNLLNRLAIEPPFVPDFSEHGYLKYPLLVKDRKQVLRNAVDNNIELGDWFLSPIHPIEKNLEKWNYYWGDNPIGEKISQHVINLPTHHDVDERYIDRIQTFLKNNRDQIFENVTECLAFKRI